MIKDILFKISISFYYRSKIERLFYYSYKHYRKSKLWNFLFEYKMFSISQQLTDTQTKLFDHLKTFASVSRPSKKKGILLVQMIQDYQYTMKFSMSSRVIANNLNLKICLYDVYWMKWIGWGNSKHEKLYKIFNKLNFEKLYLSFGEKVIFRADKKYLNQFFIRKMYNNIKNKIKTPNDLLLLKFDDILVGDLIYDSYLRYYNKPTMEKISKEVLLIVEVALNIFYNFKKLIKSKNIKALLNSYTTYIHHGITTRICLKYNIDVFIVGADSSYLLLKLNQDFPHHVLNHSLFDSHKIISEIQLKKAENSLSLRFSGGIDSATYYMRKSAYLPTELNDDLIALFNVNNRNIVIYVHDFYDSPHCNRMLQFPDLFEYLKQTLNSLVGVEGTSVFIKTHPNGTNDSKELVIDLVTHFKMSYFHILDETISNINIVNLKPDLIVTYRGTVGLEMAYFGISTVALYDNPYVNFNFVHTCYDLESYYKIVRGELRCEIDFDRNKIYSFYVQAFLESSLKSDNDVFKLIEDLSIGTLNDQYLEKILSIDFNIIKNEMINQYNNVFKLIA